MALPVQDKEWLDRIEEFKISGLSKTAWCRNQNLPVHRLDYWLKKLQRKSENPTSDKQKTNWLPITLSGSVEETHQPILLHFKDATIEVNSDFNQTVLLQIIQTLKQL